MTNSKNLAPVWAYETPKLNTPLLTINYLTVTI